ncbi:RIP metalloprotease RseP [Sediminibacterium sp.]|uniref:RIP metalloprotease RseP n=1 Tax=Sediminibacterium sp. TaxID=1917865 RepID=UPI0025CCE732|nr:RIP metalloprotease RseP [Sediminibacterium sp.]MBT9484875.1 RIP metalloprotease RseP [Sediminibacterium sp.]
MMLLAIDWASVGVKAGQFILSFSILVVLHELGHFLPAKWFGCRVDKFYLFFDPWFSLFKKKKGDTEYGLGWIPFGGYVKIAGMIDESMDKEQLKKTAEPWEFRSKPAWQRLIIMVGGVVVNILLAIVIFIGITWYWGDEQLPVKNLKYGVHVDSLGKSIGLKDGDNVVAMDGKTIENFGSIESELVLTEAKKLTVIRDGQSIEIEVPESFMQKIVEQKKFSGMLVPQYPVIVDSVSSTAVFNSGELRKGDTLIAMNGKPFTYYQEFDQLKKSAANTVAQLTAIRGKDTVQIKALVNDKGAIGFFQVSPLTILGTEHIQYDLIASIPIGFTRCWETLDRYVTGLKQLFTGKVNASDSLGSVISIGNTFPGVWDWERFWTLTGIFSIVLAFMNILPIPALDGGHALFTLYEMVSGRKPGDKFMEYAQMAGMILLMGLMAYALGLDFWRLFK